MLLSDEQALIVEVFLGNGTHRLSVILSEGGTTMRTLAKLVATVGVIGALATASAMPASAFEVYIGHPHHHYYNYAGGGYRTWNGCPPDWTIQGGVCKPYRHGPWDYNGWYR
jgi:hypothetical protein